jgi:deaminated glutathione amidase
MGANEKQSVSVAALQMCSGSDRDANLATAGKLLARAAAEGARVAVLPENFAMMARHDAERRAIAEEDGNGAIQQFLARTAQQHKLWIVGGTIPLHAPEDTRLAQACLVYDEQGARVGRYDKIHLFDVDLPGPKESYRESDYMRPGASSIVLDTPAGRLGLSVCYDMRFPELYRALQAQGAQWFSIPSAFTVPTGRAHWETLLRARAIENLCYVVASAQWGTHPNGRATWGHSLIADYWGAVSAEIAEGEGVVCAQFDLAAQAETRRKFPALQHRVL